MASTHVVLVALAIAHFLTISLTIFRLYNQARRLNILWYDDGLAAITASGGAFTLGCVLSIVLHARTPRPLEYHMVLASYFFVIWSSRACLVMTTARVRALREGPPGYILRLSFPTSMFMAIGTTYTVLAAVFCNKEPACLDYDACFCVLKPELVLCALITDILANIGLLSFNWHFFIVVVKEFDAHVARRRLVYLGFSSSICTLTVNVVFWGSYIASTPDNYVLFICLSSAVTITSVITANMSVLVGLACRALRIAGVEDPPDAEPEDTQNSRHNSVIALEPSHTTDSRTTALSLIAVSGHSEHTVTKTDSN